MGLVADEDPVAEELRMELLLLAFQVVQTLDTPVDAPWARRAFIEKMLAMLLASAIGICEIDLDHAEAEGRRLIKHARAAQVTVKAMEKAARAKTAKAQAAGGSIMANSQETPLEDFLSSICPSSFQRGNLQTKVLAANKELMAAVEEVVAAVEELVVVSAEVAVAAEVEEAEAQAAVAAADQRVAAATHIL